MADFPRLSNSRRSSPADLIFADPLDAVAEELGSVGRGRILDVGCGTAAVGIELAVQGSSVVGIDIDAVALGQAKELAEAQGVRDRVFLVRASSEAMPFRPGVVDGVLSKSTMQYVDRDRALDECRRVLRAGGVMVLIENLAYNPFVALIRFARRSARLISGDTEYVDSIRGYLSPRDLAQLAQRSGFCWFRAFHVTRAGSLILLARNPKRGWVRSLDAYLARLDAGLLRGFPAAARLAWIVAIVERVPTAQQNGETP